MAAGTAGGDEMTYAQFPAEAQATSTQANGAQDHCHATYLGGLRGLRRLIGGGLVGST